MPSRPSYGDRNRGGDRGRGNDRGGRGRNDRPRRDRY
jgi:hypothetical protein